jgi:3,4-dihydroxy 2-butanone 4-phosphate synthase / GTP cyclohydrolase II
MQLKIVPLKAKNVAPKCYNHGMAVAQTTYIPLKYGTFKLTYHKFKHDSCLSLSYGDVRQSEPVVRIHSSCLFGESFHALDCDCASQLDSTLKLIKKNRSGVIVYRYNEGRGIGLENKMKAIELQRVKKINTIEAFKILGFSADVRTYDIEIAALQDLSINTNIRVATQNPNKIRLLQEAGYTILEELHPRVQITQYNIDELLTKRDILGYHIFLDNLPEAC